MAGGVKIRDTDRGYKDLAKRLFGDKGEGLTVGILEKDASKTYPNGATVLEVALWNEFGTATIPERSFIRAYFDENGEKIERWTADLMKLVAAGKMTKKQAYDLLGFKLVGEIQQRIKAGITPENAPSTIAKKGSSTPLIDEGQLWTSISHKVGPFVR